MSTFDPVPALCSELSLPYAGVSAVVKLLAEGATVPFIARYRKEVSGGLDEVQIRTIEERRIYILELEDRRASIRSEIEKQGKLDESLAKKIAACKSKAELEDLYLPFKPKRRTRATIAKERGLEPLADAMWSQPLDSKPDDLAARFITAEVPDLSAALAGARDICAERIAEDATVRKLLREEFSKHGTIRVGKAKEHENATTKFDMYAQFDEQIATIPSHRFLAIRRGESEGILRASLEVDGEQVVPRIARLAKHEPKSPWGAELYKAVEDAFKRLLLPSVESDVRIELKLAADRGAVDVFAQNLRQLLMSAPFGTRTVIGIDPGQRTGCKCAVVDRTGKMLEHVTFNLVLGDHSVEKARQILKALVLKHKPDAIAVGNGTHGRETEAFAREVVGSSIMVVPVSESGASVYSASEVAREEFPDLDLTIRGAISIARRLQDPLAELVKVDPKSIGVGQYQHDVFQALLGRKLDEVVESCVNQVGVELNTASAPLLSRVAGIGSTLAKRIVAHRNEKGPFRSRRALLEVAGLGPRTFEQCAGFLRIHDGEHPLDASAVHPERYALVEKIANDVGVPLGSLIANDNAVRAIDPKKYLGEVGELTLNDILAELKKPGRDPRATFEPPKFRDDVRTMEDLVPGMELEGVVTNVTAFGAFVDVGVHQDGLVHVSKLADRFIKDPSEVVKVGDKLTVRVMEVDLQRKRISLVRKEATQAPTPRQPPVRQAARAPQQPPQQGFSNNPFARHFKK